MMRITERNEFGSDVQIGYLSSEAALLGQFSETIQIVEPMLLTRLECGGGECCRIVSAVIDNKLDISEPESDHWSWPNGIVLHVGQTIRLDLDRHGCNIVHRTRVTLFGKRLATAATMPPTGYWQVGDGVDWQIGSGVDWQAGSGVNEAVDLSTAAAIARGMLHEQGRAIEVVEQQWALCRRLLRDLAILDRLGGGRTAGDLLAGVERD